MPDVQDVLVQETLWESVATKSYLGLTHVRVHSEPFPESSRDLGPVMGPRRSVNRYPDPRSSHCEQTVWVSNPEGLHLRQCAAIAELVGQYQAKVTVHKGDQSENAASVLGLMLLAATQGTRLTLSATGPEAEEAVRALVELFDAAGEVSQVMRKSWHPRTPR